MSRARTPRNRYRFVPWNISLDESIQRIRNEYVENFADENSWWFVCWLSLTEQGQREAEAIEAPPQSAVDC